MKTQISKNLLVASLALASVASAGDVETLNRIEAYAGTVAIPRLNTTLLITAGDKESEGLKHFILDKANNPTELAGKKVAVLSTDGVEEIELTGVINFLKERGAQADLVSTRIPVLPKKFGVQYPEQRKTHILTARFMENATWVKIDKFFDQVKAEQYDAVIIPGGAWNPDTLRNTPEAIAFVQAANAQGKTVAAICHGPLVLVTAGILKGKAATAYWAVQIDLANAGAKVADEAVVVDHNIITSRFPYDLPQFMGAITSALTK